MIDEIRKKQLEMFQSGKTKDVEFRLTQLGNIKRWIKDHQDEICSSLKADLNKSKKEAMLTEIMMSEEEIKYAIRHIKKWCRPQRVKSSLFQFTSKSYIYNEPFGSVLIIAPWNYPFMLSIVPLIGAISAGNCTILKPSPQSPNTSSLLKKMSIDLFEENYIFVYEDSEQDYKSLLAEKYDFIFFTGSPQVGKIMMKKAAQDLTPITLELGGKSPCIIDNTAAIKKAAKRIVWGKFLNAGQTCVAPDYLFVHGEIYLELIKHMIEYINKFYGKVPEQNEAYPKIVNKYHYERLKKLMSNVNLLSGGGSNDQTLQIAPTLVLLKDYEDSLMDEEIFGPILPIIVYSDIEAVVKYINDHHKPLALYLFTEKKDLINKVLFSISYGGGCINDTILHMASPYMPFGGVGFSGMGKYHGKYSYLTFTNQKGIMEKGKLDLPLRYPPYK